MALSGFSMKNIKGTMKESVDSIQKKVKDGDLQAQLDLAALYRSGKKGVNKSATEALKLYQNAAQKGNALACYTLGMMYKNGEGDNKQDSNEAKKWFEKAKDMGFDGANKALSLLTTGGQGFQNRLLGGAADEKKQAQSSTNSPVETIAKTPLLTLSETGKPLKSVFEDIDYYILENHMKLLKKN